MLLVCEGKTERVYFLSLARHKSLTAVQIENAGPHPRTLVAEAVRRKTKEQKGDPYDSVWCVFDKNSHERIHEAFTRARDCHIKIAFSNPCIELWFYVHFQYSTAHKTRGEMLRKLKTHMPGFRKGADVYNLLLAAQQVAMRNAESLRNHHRATAKNIVPVPPNPWTSVDELVQYLNQLGEQVGRASR